MLTLLPTFAVGATLFGERVHVHAAAAVDAGCVPEAQVQAAMDDRFAAAPVSAPDAPRWELVYRAKTSETGEVQIDFELTGEGESALQRNVTVGATDCASTPALLVAVVERYFRGIGWTTGAALPKIVPHEAEARAPEPPTLERSFPNSEAPPPAASPERARPAWSLRAMAWLTGYPSFQPTASASIEMRYRWLAPEIMLWLPTATTNAIDGGGLAHLDSWSAQLWLSAAVDRPPFSFRLGAVSGFAIETASTTGLARTGTRGRAAFDLGIGGHFVWSISSAFGVGLAAWGGRTLLEPDFFIDAPTGQVALGPPWQPSWKGGIALDFDFLIFR